jgi:hypothetical protein
MLAVGDFMIVRAKNGKLKSRCCLFLAVNLRQAEAVLLFFTLVVFMQKHGFIKRMK